MKRTSAVAWAAFLATLICGWWVCARREARPDADDRPAAEAPSRSEVDQQIALLRDRISAKLYITDEVIAGRLSLLEAEAAFREWDVREPQQSYEYPLNYPPGASEEERRCRAVITYVSVQAPRDQAPALIRRLEAELEERLRDGTLRRRVATKDCE